MDEKTPMTSLPYGRQWITEEDIQAVVEVLRSGWITQGPRIEAFEEILAKEVEAKEAVVCSSGTAALHLMALSLEMGDEDVVIVPSLTFLATANAARFTGTRVIFCDIDSKTFNLDLNHLESLMKKLKGKKKVVIPVHFAGLPCPMETVGELAERYGWLVLEDGCHALGATYPTRSGKSHKVGKGCHSLMTAFSFHPVKAITTGEGGAVTTNDPKIAARLRRLRNHGTLRDPSAFQFPHMGIEAGKPNPWYYEMVELGFNYRMTDIQAALGISQIKRLPFFIHRRETISNRYRHAFESHPYLTFQEIPPGYRSAWHLFVILIAFEDIGKSRRQVMEELRALGILTQVHYLPLHLHPYYRHLLGTGENDLPGAESYYRKALSIPLFPAMTDEDVERVIQAIYKVIKPVG